MKTMVLFSGGKDSFYSLQKTLENGSVELIVSSLSESGDTQLHAGPETDQVLRQAQLDLLGLPYKQIIIGAGENYLHEFFVELNKLVQEHSITHLITGDLWHPYTSGIGDMLAGALGVTLIRPAREACPNRESDLEYMNTLVKMGITSIIVSVRETNLPASYVGKTIDQHLIADISSQGIDAAAEGGEYQSYVLRSPIMKGEIIIDDFEVKLVDGKNGKEKFHRMFVTKFHTKKQ